VTNITKIKRFMPVYSLILNTGSSPLGSVFSTRKSGDTEHNVADRTKNVSTNKKNTYCLTIFRIVRTIEYNLSSFLIPHSLVQTGAQMFRRQFSSRQHKLGRKRRLCLKGLEQLEPRIVLAGDGLSIVLDYSLDTNNFFNDQIRKDTLQRAATVLENRINDELAAITPSGGNNWDATITHPGNGASHQLHNLTIPLGSIIIFAGARNIGSLGIGGPGGYQASGTSAFLDSIADRGQTGIDSSNSANTTDYAPWGGHITFDTSPTWNFGDDQPSAGENDFYSVALHEIGHVLGIGTADSWNNLVNASNLFTGPASAAANSGDVPLTSGSNHWNDDLDSTLTNTSAVQEAAMDPNLTVGTRKQFTVIDWAALDDIGWEIPDTFAPTIDAISNTTINEDSNEKQLNLTGITAGGIELQPLGISVSSDNTSLTGTPTITYASNETTGTLKLTPLANQSGTATITVTVTDAGFDELLSTTEDNASFTTTFDVIVTAVNDKPTINAIENLDLLENATQQVVQLAGISAGGGETQELIITATSSNPALMDNPVVNYTSDNPTGSITFQPIPNMGGQTTITVTITDAGLDDDITTDGDNDVTSTSFVVTTNNTNSPPTINVVPDLALLEDAVMQVVDLTGITAGPSETQPLAVTATSNNPSLIADPLVTYDSANDNGSLSFSPLADQFGTATITVTVTDAGFDKLLTTTEDNASFTTTFDVVVSAVNDNPTINTIENLELVVNATQQIVQLAGISAGVGETQDLFITATSSNSALIDNPVVNYSSDNPTGSISFQPTINIAGQTTITVSITDAGLDGDIATVTDNGVTSTSFVVTINDTNAAPTIDSISNVTTVEDGATQQISLAGISAGANEAQPLQITTSSNNITLIAAPLVTYISNQTTGVITFIPLANQSGTATISVQITDGGLDENLSTPNDNASKTTTFQITVTAVNDDPTIHALGDLTINEDATLQTVALSGISAGENESQPIAVTVSSNNTDLIEQPILSYTSTDSAGTLQFIPAANLSGTATITVRVTDGGLDANLATTDDNAVTTDSFYVDVTATNDPPTIDPVDDVTITEDSATFTIDLTGITAGLAETQPLAVTIANDNTDLFSTVALDYFSTDSTGSIYLTPTTATSGTATFTLTVTDGGLDNNLSTTADNDAVSEEFNVSITPAFPWHNYNLPLDVNGDNVASPIDVLMIIQEINRNGSYELPTPRSELGPPFYDVDRDGWITPSDALQIINYLNFNEHQVAFSFDFTDLNRAPITSVETGSFFMIDLYAEDLSPVPNGVYSAYIDMVYDASLVRLVNGPSFVSPFVNGQSGTTTEQGIIDEWGSFAGLEPTGSGRQLVSTAQFLATAAGSYLVGSGRADISPLHDVLVYGSNTTVMPELIEFGSLTITITDSEAEGEDPLEPLYAAELESTLDLLFN
jgi:hypothetical protein